MYPGTTCRKSIQTALLMSETAQSLHNLTIEWATMEQLRKGLRSPCPMPEGYKAPSTGLWSSGTVFIGLNPVPLY